MANLFIINDILEKKKITKSQFAKRIGISYTGLIKILKMNSTNLDTLERIASVLNVPVSLFFDPDPGASPVLSEPYSKYGKLDEKEEMREEIIKLQREIIRLQAEIINLNSK